MGSGSVQDMDMTPHYSRQQPVVAGSGLAVTAGYIVRVGLFQVLRVMLCHKAVNH
jgi:hypothetical protein